MQKNKINSYHLNAIGMTLSGLFFLIGALIFEQNAFIPLDNKNLFAIFFLLELKFLLKTNQGHLELSLLLLELKKEILHI